MNKKIKIHITDGDFALHNQELVDTDVITTGSAYGRFIFREFPHIVIVGNRFINGGIKLGAGVKNSVIVSNVCIGGSFRQELW